jgi:hypothetical protein
MRSGQRRPRFSRCLDRWPDRDRDAWNAACRPATRLNPGGPAGHLKPVTRDDHARHYGCFLDFLDRRGLLRLHEPAAVNITPENIGTYVTERKDHVSSVTLHGSIAKLRRAARFMAPDRDFTWLAEIEKDLALEMRPRSKAHRMVMIEVLAEAGLILIDEAETSPSLSEIARARQVRDGNGESVSVLPHQTEKFHCLGDRPKLCGSQRHMVDRTLGLRDQGAPPR